MIREGLMRCYECSQAGEVRDAVGLCHHCSAALCAEHARVTMDPMIAPAPLSKEIILPKRARVLLCPMCHAALEQVRRVA